MSLHAKACVSNDAFGTKRPRPLIMGLNYKGPGLFVSSGEDRMPPAGT